MCIATASFALLHDNDELLLHSDDELLLGCCAAGPDMECGQMAVSFSYSLNLCFAESAAETQNLHAVRICQITANMQSLLICQNFL